MQFQSHAAFILCHFAFDSLALSDEHAHSSSPSNHQAQNSSPLLDGSKTHGHPRRVLLFISWPIARLPNSSQTPFLPPSNPLHRPLLRTPKPSKRGASCCCPCPAVRDVWYHHHPPPQEQQQMRRRAPGQRRELRPLLPLLLLCAVVVVRAAAAGGKGPWRPLPSFLPRIRVRRQASQGGGL
jgi:hypothetical protein